MPKNIVAPPAAVVAVDRLTLQADDARGEGGRAAAVGPVGTGPWCSCFSEE
jgi:hypothetical protein